MRRPEFANEAAWRFWRLRRALGLLRLALLGIFVGLLVHVLGI